MGELQCIFVFSEFFLPERNYDILVHYGNSGSKKKSTKYD